MLEQKKLLADTVAAIEKQFGQGSIMMLGAAKDSSEEVPVVSTGALSLDLALGIGGIPQGRIVEIYGPEASGKTTLTLQLIAQIQRQGGVAAFIDAEHSLDPAYALSLGVDTEALLVSQPDNGEQALEIVSMLVTSQAVNLIVIDSVAALTPKAEIEGSMGDSHVGLQARLMSQALRKLTGHVARTKTTVVFINQLRMKIGVMFGSPETTTGGNALKFYASVRLDVRRIGTIKQGEIAIGNRVKVKVVKNKVAPPFREAEFDILFGKGISVAGDVLDLGVAKGFVEKAGSWFAFEGQRIGQGRENARQFLENDPQALRRLTNQVRLGANLAALADLAPAKAPSLAATGTDGAPLSVSDKSRKTKDSAPRDPSRGSVALKA